MSTEPGPRMFELSLRPKPVIVSFDPRKRTKLPWGKSVGSDGQAIAIYEDDVGASGDVHMRDTELENGGQEAADGDNESGEEMDEDNEQEASEREVHEEDEMGKSADQLASDEEDDDISELAGITSEGENSGEEWQDSEDDAIPLVAEDCSQIFDPDSMSFIPIPTDLADKRKALLDLFLFYTPFDYLDDACKIDANVIIRRFPNNLWWSTFNRDETSTIVEEQEKQFMNGILARLAKIMAQWQDGPGFPAIPDTRTEIELAKTTERSLERKAYFQSLLRHRNTQTEDWIMTVFDVFQPARGLKSLVLEDLRFDMDTWASFVATLAEAYFFHAIITRAELELVGAECVRLLIDGLLLHSASLNVGPSKKVSRNLNL